MSATRSLSTRAITKEDVVERLNREVVPFVRQLAPGTAITGSRATFTAFELQLLAILAATGIITDGTTA